LLPAGIVCPPIDRNLVGRYLAYLEGLELLPEAAPRQRVVSG
jgi:hypothetical protein